MYKNVLEGIAGVEIYPIISLILFVLVFCSMLVWAFRKDKRELDTIAQLPLDSQQTLAEKM